MTPPETDLLFPDARELEHSLTSLLRLSESLNSIFDLDRLLEVLVEQAIAFTDAESGCAGLRMAGEMTCGHFLQSSGIAPVSYDRRPDTGWAARTLANKNYYFTNDASNDAVIAPAIREQFGIKSGMCIPLADRQNDVMAFFEVYNKRSGGKFTQRDLSNSLAAAKIASLAIQNGLTYRKLRALAAFSQSLTLTGDLDQILGVVGHHLENIFHCDIAIFLPADEVIVERFKTPAFQVTAKELIAATSCWKHSGDGGAETAGDPDAFAHYLPFTVRSQVIGVLGLTAAPNSFPREQRELLAGFIAQSALAIERGMLEQRLRRIRFLDESDRLQNALLAAISHEVRAPLAAITAAVSGMLHPTAPFEPQQQRQLLHTAEYEAKRLHRLMNNLLNVTRLQAGVSRAKLEPCDLLDVIGAALEEAGAITQQRHVSVELAADLPLVPMNFELITQVVVNLLSNAFKFSPADQPVSLSGRINNGWLEVTIADRGIGVPQQDLDRVFQKFHRLAESSSVDGLGLGLSICKEFVEAHGGRIWLENSPAGGTVSTFRLPVQTSAPF